MVNLFILPAQATSSVGGLVSVSSIGGHPSQEAAKLRAGEG